MSYTFNPFEIVQQAEYEVQQSGELVTLPEGSGGETAPGPVNVSFGETNFGKWPDSFEAIGLKAFRADLVDAFQNADIKGAEWYPINIISIRNKRLTRVTPPIYRWCRLIGRIRTTPYYVRSVPTERRHNKGSVVFDYVKTEDPVELDSFGCRIVNKPSQRHICHKLQLDTWDGSDMMRVLPVAGPPYEVFSSRFADLLQELKVENMKAFPLTKGYGL